MAVWLFGFCLFVWVFLLLFIFCFFCFKSVRVFLSCIGNHFAYLVLSQCFLESWEGEKTWQTSAVTWWRAAHTANPSDDQGLIHTPAFFLFKIRILQFFLCRGGTKIWFVKAAWLVLGLLPVAGAEHRSAVGLGFENECCDSSTLNDFLSHWNMSLKPTEIAPLFLRCEPKSGPEDELLCNSAKCCRPWNSL